MLEFSILNNLVQLSTTNNSIPNRQFATLLPLKNRIVYLIFLKLRHFDAQCLKNLNSKQREHEQLPAKTRPF